MLRNDSNHHTSYGYHKPDDCRPNFYRQKSCLQRTESLQCATLQTPSFATSHLQINVTGEVFLKLIRKIVRSRYAYCGFQCQPNKSNISRRPRYTNFSLCHFNADNIKKKILQINSLISVVIICAICSNLKKICTFPTLSNHVFHLSLTVNSDCFHKQHYNGH